MSRKRNEKKKNSILKAVVIVLAVFVLSSLIATPIICRVIIDSMACGKGPENQELPITADVSLPNSYYDVPNEKGVVIISPGIGDDYGKWEPLANILNNNGYDVLTYFQGKEDLKNMSSSIENLEKRINTVQINPADKDIPVFLLGYSLGGYACCSETGFNKVNGVISIYGFDNANEIMKSFAKRYVGPLADIETPFLYGYNYLLTREFSNVSASENLLNSGTPALVIGNPEDPVVTEEISIYSKLKKEPNSLPSNILLFENKDAQKGHSAPIENSEIITRILNFLNELSA